MYNYKIKPSFVSPEMPMARSNKTGFNIMIVHFHILRKLDIIRYDNMIFQSGWELVLIHPVVINWFRSHTWKYYLKDRWIPSMELCLCWLWIYPGANFHVKMSNLLLFQFRYFVHFLPLPIFFQTRNVCLGSASTYTFGLSFYCFICKRFL